MAAHATCAAGAEAAERVRFVRAGSQWLERGSWANCGSTLAAVSEWCWASWLWLYVPLPVLWRRLRRTRARLVGKWWRGLRSNPKSLLLPVNLVAQTWPITRTFGTTLYWVGAGSRSFEAFGVVKLRLHGGPWRAN